MGLAEWWHYRDVPRPAETPRLLLEVATPTLAGLGFRDSAELLLARLGPPDSYTEAQRGHWLYLAWGLRFDVFESKIEAIAVATDGSYALGFPHEAGALKPFPGEVIMAPGQPAKRLADLRSPELRALLGEPSEEELDEDGELQLRYETDDRALDLGFAPSGELVYLEVEDLRD